LSISKGLVEMLGGEIWLESKYGEGTSFFFTVPYKPVNKIEKDFETLAEKSENKTILIAEDEEFNYLLLEEHLMGLNMKIIHAKNGKEALDICRANKDINLILMDIKMPVLDGYEAALQIKEFRPNLPIVAQTAYALAKEKEKYSSTAFDDYITKPFEETYLKQIIHKYIIDKLA
jgi:CheY-like chemotaxis protein